MVKRTPQDSIPQSNVPVEEEDFSRMHPLNRHRTQTEELLEKALGRKDADEFKIKEVAEWRQCINAVASTPNGRMLIRSMMQHSGHFDPPPIGNPHKMVTNAIRASFYLTWIKPYLEPDVKKEID